MDEHPAPTSNTRAVRVLTRAQIAGLMTAADYLAAVESAFLASAEGQATSPPPMHLPATEGGFHVKGARLGSSHAAFKINGNFPGNPARGLPTIQGVLVLCDPLDGSVLALLDSIEVTLQRTAAATALAARFLARPSASTLTICGCGEQAAPHLTALAAVLPLRRVFAFDVDGARAERFARSRTTPQLEVAAVEDLRSATLASDVVVTCTTSRQPFLARGDVRPGAFVAAVGADNPEKSEIAPDLMAAAAVFVDVREQALTMGDVHQAVKAGVMRAGEIRGDLAELVAGRVRGRRSEAEITLFDSTGTALQDVASAARVYERAVKAGVGSLLRLADA